MTKKNNTPHGAGLAHPENEQQLNFADLIPVISGVIGRQPTSVVGAKALHIALKVGRDFSSWITDRFTEYGFAIGSDYAVHRMISPKLGKSPDGAACSQITTGRPGKDYLLTINTAKEIAMLERNEQGRAVRRYFIQCEEELQREAPQKASALRRELKSRFAEASYFKPMCAALEAYRTDQGKTTQHHHYTTESNMLARIVLDGTTAKQWAQANGITGEPRDHMNLEQLDHLSYLEQTNITLIELAQPYPQRKAELMRLSQRWLSKRKEAANA